MDRHIDWPIESDGIDVFILVFDLAHLRAIRIAADPFMVKNRLCDFVIIATFDYAGDLVRRQAKGIILLIHG